MAGANAPNLLLVGAGNMGGALLKGWLDRDLVSGATLAVADPSPPRDIVILASEIGASLGPSVAAVATDPFDAVVIAIKPQIMPSVLPSLNVPATHSAVFLSIAAGTRIQAMVDQLGGTAAIARAMPNTPAAIGRGASGLFFNDFVTGAQKDLCRTLLGAVGEVVEVPEESLIDAVTAVSGSGPAYVFYLIECLAEAARNEGLPPDVADRLARATVTGAGELAYGSSESASQLRKNVTSPGGTTAAALEVLMGERGLAELMKRAVGAAAKRAKELAE